jgi:hypothetical protein
VVGSGPDQLVSIDPVSGDIGTRIDLPGCSGAHGVRFHPDGQSAFVACDSNDVLVRVQLEGDPAVVTAPTGSGPDRSTTRPPAEVSSTVGNARRGPWGGREGRGMRSL